MIRFIFCLFIFVPMAASGAESSDNLQSAFQAFARKVETKNVEALPALSGGRLKPIHTVARETILLLTGRYRFFGIDALPFYLSLAVFPDGDLLRILEVREIEVRVKLELDPKRRHFSASELAATALQDMASPLLRRAGESADNLTPVEKGIIETYHQLSIFESIRGGGHFLGVLDRSAPGSGADTSTLTLATRDYLTSLIQPGGDSTPAANLKSAASSQPVPDDMTWQLNNLGLEVLYNKAQLFFWAAVGYIGIALLSLFLGKPSKRQRRLVVLLSLIPLLLHIAGFILRVRITGFAPVTNMYGTMIWVSLGVSLFNLILYRLYNQSLLSGILWAGAAAILLLTESLPLILSPDLDPVVAVLRSNFWLTTHVLTITISYSAFTAAMLIGNIALIRSLYKASDEDFIAAASHSCYRLIQLGVFLITAGIILGGVWADYSWGRFWGWDPKETWALIVDLGFLAILHARHGGHLSRFGLLASAPAGYLLVIMAWYGVNFILATGLHSYGFSTGGTRMIVSYLAVQAAIYAFAAVLWILRSARAKKALE